MSSRRRPGLYGNEEEPMATVIASLSMSLDGFIAQHDDDPGPIFEWYEAGDIAFPWPGSEMVSKVSPASAAYLHDVTAGAGALVVGRRLFDITSGWDGTHPIGVPVFVVTHRPVAGWPRPGVPTTIVTEGLEAAVAQAREVAGDKTISLSGPDIIQQALRAGLVDVIQVDLTPVLLGDGIRFFGELVDAPVLLENPTVIEGDRVTHLTYRVRR
jgi:dihydrofolate reductase